MINARCPRIFRDALLIISMVAFIVAGMPSLHPQEHLGPSVVAEASECCTTTTDHAAASPCNTMICAQQGIEPTAVAVDDLVYKAERDFANDVRLRGRDGEPDSRPPRAIGRLAAGARRTNVGLVQLTRHSDCFHMILSRHASTLTRRTFMAGSIGAIGALALPIRDSVAAPRAFTLIPAAATAAISGPSNSETAVWAYNGTVPGPVIRARRGERLRITVENRLPDRS